MIRIIFGRAFLDCEGRPPISCRTQFLWLLVATSRGFRRQNERYQWLDAYARKFPKLRCRLWNSTTFGVLGTDWALIQCAAACTKMCELCTSQAC